MTLNYVEHLRRESARFRAVLGATVPDARVPSCPDWTAADLGYHLAEVQTFWGTIVRERLTDVSAVETPPRPEDYARLLAMFDTASAALVEALDGAADDTHVWSWSDDETVGFVRRRQAHEALIHPLDAELRAP